MDWNWVAIAAAISYAIGIVALFIVPANRKPGEATAVRDVRSRPNATRTIAYYLHTAAE